MLEYVQAPVESQESSVHGFPSLQLQGAHTPDAVQFSVPVHVPQLPPQPSSPQVLPVQSGTHWQSPAALHCSLTEHVPQVPPQPLSPHSLPPHCATHSQFPLIQALPAPQAIEAPLQVPAEQASPTVQALPSSQAAELLMYVQAPVESQESSVHGFPSLQLQGAHTPDAVQFSVPVHVPQLPPQPSSPQVLPVQSGTHWQSPAALHCSLTEHVPQVPPQPLSPHSLPPHCATHSQFPLIQALPAPQAIGAPLHVPAEQASPTVQALPSSQAAELLEWPQPPAAGSQ